MTSYNPPLENLPIFDSSVFNNVEEPLTTSSAGTQFLKYPIAQGTETLSDIIVLGTSNFSGTETHNGQIIANNVITQNNAILNINQTDHTNNNLGNVLRATNIYGDVKLLRPTGGNGGIIQFNDITNVVVGNNFTQVYQSGSGFTFTGQSLGGNCLFRQNTAAGVLRSPLNLLSTGSTFATTSTDGNNITLAVLETISTKYIGIQPSVSVGQNMPVLAGDNMIVSKNQSNTLNTTALVVGCQSNVSNGLKIDSVGNTTLIGQGGTTNGVYTTSFSCDGTNSTIKGPAVFSSTTAPTSAQTIPASNDNSNKIPTTEWVQAAIVNGAASPLYYRAYKFMTNPVIPLATTTIGNLTINFTNGSTLKINDSVNIRFSIRFDYNITSSTAQSLYYNTFYGNLIIYPNRIQTNTAVNPVDANPVYLNGSFFGSTAYTYSNVSLAPSGRWTWTDNYTNSALNDPTNQNPQMIVITSLSQASITLNYYMPYNTATATVSNCSLSTYLEVVNDNNSANTIVSTSGGVMFDSVKKNF